MRRRHLTFHRAVETDEDDRLVLVGRRILGGRRLCETSGDE